MLSSFKSQIGNVYCSVYILELLTGVPVEKTGRKTGGSVFIEILYFVQAIQGTQLL